MSANKHPDFRVRIPEDLKEKIRVSAEKHNRSMGADIIARVEQTFKHEESKVTPSATSSLIITAIYQTLREEGYTHEKAEQVVTDSVKKLVDMDFIKKNFNNAVDR
ncbi:Arc family DNA-binding protein [Psychrobacter pacificensis]|uniref:Arc family DNA-binding protein n=1 Tax=Psychrobacter pacificensis TaxID=112002 RepID=UPI003CFD1DA0